ncbi:MAG: MFS transporter, partial [Gammaproteobacteria bacterium]|nr:MFS transporter [Gammaproteobacteria bacterium]
SVGRRKAMFTGYAVFFVGTIMSLYATDLNQMLVSRLLQGFGMAAPKVLSTAIVRDLFLGRAMARVMSFVMVIFILVPMLAPLFGQVMLSFFDWRAIFIAIGVFALISMCWYWLRQAETLNADHQSSFTWHRTKNTIKTIVTTPQVIGNTLSASILSGPFIFYLGSSQQLFQQTYQLGEWFPYYFALIALAIGMASFVNGKKVMKHGMLKILTFALRSIVFTSSIFMVIVWLKGGLPDLLLTTIYMFITFFSLGLTFGNMNALAMEPLGKMAGIGAAFVGAMSTFIASLLSVVIGWFYNDTMYPLVISFACAGLLAMLVVWRVNRGSD